MLQAAGAASADSGRVTRMYLLTGAILPHWQLLEANLGPPERDRQTAVRVRRCRMVPFAASPADHSGAPTSTYQDAASGAGAAPSAACDAAPGQGQDGGSSQQRAEATQLVVGVVIPKERKDAVVRAILAQVSGDETSSGADSSGADTFGSSEG